MGRITWVCATCAQHFTREYGANRHNNNLHEGKGIVVRLLDYIIGRINGQFLPRDPLAYRIKKGKEKKNNLLFGSSYNDGDNNFESKAIAHSMDDILSYDNIISKPPNPPSKTNSTYHHSDNKYDSDNPNKRPYHSNLVSQPSSKADDDNNNKLHSSPTDKLVERRLKLEEFKILVNKYYPPQNASQLLALVTYMVIQENHDDFLDKQLTFLRNIGKGELCHENAFDKSAGNNRENTAKPYSPLSDFSLLQPILDKKVDRSAQDEHTQARAKLAEIGQILSPFCPQQFVQNVITGLINQYNMTRDCSILDRAVENHRRNVERYYTRY
jgi:hypothetical protein